MRIKANLILLLTALIWGSAFVAQRLAASQLGVFLINGSRFLLGGLILLALARFRMDLSWKKLRWMLLAGGLLFAASALQQAGLITTTAANAGFITGIYVVLVPVLLLVFGRQSQAWPVWAAVILTMVGMYLLSGTGEIRFIIGDWLVLIGALFWALHVIVVGRAVEQVDVLQFSAGQFLVTAVLDFAFGLPLEWGTLPGLADAWPAILYIGIFSTSIAYTLQAYGQKFAPPADAAIILSMEAVFSAIFGYLILAEKLNWSQLLGCALIFGAILLAQYPLLAAQRKAGQPALDS